MNLDRQQPRTLSSGIRNHALMPLRKVVCPRREAVVVNGEFGDWLPITVHLDGEISVSRLIGTLQQGRCSRRGYPGDTVFSENRRAQRRNLDAAGDRSQRAAVTARVSCFCRQLRQGPTAILFNGPQNQRLSNGALQPKATGTPRSQADYARGVPRSSRTAAGAFRRTAGDCRGLRCGDGGRGSEGMRSRRGGSAGDG